MKHHVRTLAVVLVAALSLGATALAATTDVVGRSAARATVAPAPKPAAPAPKKYSCTTTAGRTTCVGQVTEKGKTYTTTIVKVDGKVVSRSTKAAKAKAKATAKAKAGAKAKVGANSKPGTRAGKKTSRR